MKIIQSDEGGRRREKLKVLPELKESLVGVKDPPVVQALYEYIEGQRRQVVQTARLPYLLAVWATTGFKFIKGRWLPWPTTGGRREKALFSEAQAASQQETPLSRNQQVVVKAAEIIKKRRKERRELIQRGLGIGVSVMDPGVGKAMLSLGVLADYRQITGGDMTTDYAREWLNYIPFARESIDIQDDMPKIRNFRMIAFVLEMANLAEKTAIDMSGMRGVLKPREEGVDINTLQIIFPGVFSTHQKPVYSHQAAIVKAIESGRLIDLKSAKREILKHLQNNPSTVKTLVHVIKTRKPSAETGKKGMEKKDESKTKKKEKNGANKEVSLGVQLREAKKLAVIGGTVEDIPEYRGMEVDHTHAQEWFTALAIMIETEMKMNKVGMRKRR